MENNDYGYLNGSIETLKDEIKLKEEQVERTKYIYAEQIKSQLGKKMKKDLKPTFFNKIKNFFNKLLSVYE